MYSYSACLQMLSGISKTALLQWKIMAKVRWLGLTLNDNCFRSLEHFFFYPGVSMSAYRENKKLSDFFDVISLSIDKSGEFGEWGHHAPCTHRAPSSICNPILIFRKPIHLNPRVSRISYDSNAVASRKECVRVDSDRPYPTFTRGGKPFKPNREANRFERSCMS